jgi:aspartyl-tRNA(Asn)/glutamyl-tRNA(Gln) amidotransferase subunit A
LGALGTDTGGSVRQPAALCNLVGLRPTYGRISRYGIIAFASSLDQIGPLTRTVKDAALLTRVMAGHDPLDGTTRSEPVPDYVASLSPEIDGLRVGVPREYLEEGLQPDVERAVRDAIDQFEALGAEIIEITLPHTDHGIAVYYLVATAEASANLARFDGIRYGPRAEGKSLDAVYGKTRAQGFGAEVQRRIMLGTYALSAGYYDAYYLQAQKVRTLIKQDFDRAFEDVDVIVGPTSPVTAFRLGERIDDPLQMYLADTFTIPQALAGIPAINIPCGFDADGLPVGLQLAAPALEEGRLFHAAYAYEQATDWHQRRPTLRSTERGE